MRGNPDLEILLIKRAHHDGDPWSGHVALPGGRWEESDPNLLATAIRETREETGVDLAGGQPLGRLDEVRPNSPRLPRIAIHPFVFGVRPGTDAHAASREVDKVHWVALATLRDPAVAGTVEIPMSGGAREFPCLRLEGEVVWGLTYRILTDFLRLYPEEKLRGSG